jgi:type I restriction enzyme S subunit
MMFYKETDFQKTPIGRIPKEWDVAKLEETCEKVKAGGTPLTSNKEYWNGRLPFVKIEDMTLAGKYLSTTKSSISEKGLDNSSTWIVPENSLLFAMYGSMGEVSINRIPVTTNQAILGIIPHNREDVEFLYYWYSFFKPKWKKYAKPTTQANLTAEILRSSLIPFPSQEERRTIVGVLGVVDLAVAKAGEVIAKIERLKKGLMQELLTRGIEHKEYKQTTIGKTPKEWEIKKVSDLFIVETGATPPTRQREYWNEGTVNWITPTDLSKLNGKTHIKNSERKITEKALKETSLTVMPEGSLIISTRAPVGYVAVLEEPATFNQGCKGLIPKNHDKILSEFYCYYLLNKKQMLENLSSGSTFKELSKERLQNFNMPSPSFREQQRIAELLLTIDKKIEFERSEKARLERIKGGLMDLLLIGKIRVKVD